MRHKHVKIAIASSGLGHVARGIETWALDTARGLHRSGVDTTLFAGAELPDDGRRLGAPIVVLPCLRRFQPRTQRLVRHMPGFAWRWGLKSGYGWEELTFWLRLWPRLVRGRFDILHVQDSWLAFWCRRFRKAGMLKTREVLAHATEERSAWLSQFDYVQHFTPWHLEQALQELNGGAGLDPSSAHPHWVAMPNPVDVDAFRPRAEGARSTLRADLGIAEDAFVVGTAATIKRPHKRIDYLIREFAAYACDETVAQRRDAFLLIAGARTPETDSLVRMARDLCGNRVHVIQDVPRGEMPAFYQALDVFVLTSLVEMMPIAMLEAMASGVPILCNKVPNLEWMIAGRGDESCGACLDMAQRGALKNRLSAVTAEWMDSRSRAARQRAEGAFSEASVMAQYVAYYERVLRSARHVRCSRERRGAGARVRDA